MSDDSNGAPDGIVEMYTAIDGFIKVTPPDQDHPRNFAAQVYAINAGIAQLQRTGYAFIGVYFPLPHGAPETYAEFTARMKDWSVASFSGLIAFHYRCTGLADGPLRS